MSVDQKDDPYVAVGEGEAVENDVEYDGDPNEAAKLWTAGRTGTSTSTTVRFLVVEEPWFCFK